nr:polypeptide N acetylgalactosaminyltransferase [Hymenolepis microstoma]
MVSIEKRLVLKIIVLTSIFWICVQFVLLQLLVSPPNTQKARSPLINSSDHEDNLEHTALMREAAALLSRYGGAGGAGSLSLLGEGGKAVRLPTHLMADSKAKFALNQFDVVISDLISVNRSLPDVRHDSCQNGGQMEEALQSGLNTSVIIVFHNEAWSTLLRTVHSVLNRSPPQLLQEVILVDDFSDRDYLGDSLTTYVKALGPRVRLIRLPQRSGLIRARLAGAKEARGSTLTFLDAHCEATEGWLEPLIAHVAQYPHSVVCPAIDVISDTSFEYLQSTERTWGVFSWDLLFDWDVIAPREELRRQDKPAMPIRTPAMAGGLFLIRRDYFYNLGSYDEGMEVWGGENVEMSLRVWQCGGELLIIPCSRVGHVFRKVSPYSWPGGVTHVLHRNRIRTALVWLDEFVEFPFSLDSSLRNYEYGNISERIALRKRLKCKSFSWYLQNIFPESNIRPHPIRLGQIRNPIHGVCFDTNNGRRGQAIVAAACRNRDNAGPLQTFSISSANEITASTGCLGAARLNDKLTIGQCEHTSSNYQKFIYDEQTKHIIHEHSHLCVRVDATKHEMPISLANCSTSNEFAWELPPAFFNRTALAN